MKKKRILAVDDRDDALETIELILGDMYELKLTKDPSEALELIRSSFFSLAILDQRISPDVSGIDLFGELRDIQPDLRAIILTGYPELDKAVGSIRTGIFDYISKKRKDLASELRARVERALAADSHELEFLELIKRGEGAELEFKSSARWDIRQGRVNRDLGGVVLKTVAAFLNSKSGGVLLLGVDDNGRPIGLQHDYRTLKKQDRDGFESFLMDLLLAAFGKDVSTLLAVDFQTVNGNDVCRIYARPAP